MNVFGPFLQFDPPTESTIGLDIEDELVPGVLGRGGLIEVEIWRDGPHGPVCVSRELSRNTVVNIGKKRIWRFASGVVTTHHFDQFRIGTSGAAANSGQSNVLSPVTGTINTADQKTMDAGRTWRWVISYPSGTPGSSAKSATGIDEVVLLDTNTSPGGSAFMRATFTSVNKTKADKLKITYKVRIT